MSAPVIANSYLTAEQEVHLLPVFKAVSDHNQSTNGETPGMVIAQVRLDRAVGITACFIEPPFAERFKALMDEYRAWKGAQS